MKLADNGFGELVSVANPYGVTTTVYAKDGGKLAQFTADTPDHALAISMVRKALGHMALGRGKWDAPPVLALIRGGAQ
jgi:hypothetical protein